MNRLTRFSILIISAMSLTSCETLEVYQAGHVEIVDLDHAETDWENAERWKCVFDDPPTFVPVGWSTNSESSTREGKWMVDPQDGARFFVPRKKFRGLNQKQWRAEAKKGINYNTEEKKKIKKNNVKTNVLLPLFLPLEVIGEGIGAALDNFLTG